MIDSTSNYHRIKDNEQRIEKLESKDSKQETSKYVRCIEFENVSRLMSENEGLRQDVERLRHWRKHWLNRCLNQIIEMRELNRLRQDVERLKLRNKFLDELATELIKDKDKLEVEIDRLKYKLACLENDTIDQIVKKLLHIKER